MGNGISYVDKSRQKELINSATVEELVKTCDKWVVAGGQSNFMCP